MFGSMGGGGLDSDEVGIGFYNFPDLLKEIGTVL